MFTWTLSTVSDFSENFAFMKSRLVSFSTVTMAQLTVFVFFQRLQLEILYFIPSDTDMKKLATSQILNWKIPNLADFGRTLPQRVNFWSKSLQRVQLWYKFLKRAKFRTKVYTTCHTSKGIICNVSVFGLNFYFVSYFEDYAINRSLYFFIYSMNMKYFAFFVLFQETWF